MSRAGRFNARHAAARLICGIAVNCERRGVEAWCNGINNRLTMAALTRAALTRRRFLAASAFSAAAAAAPARAAQSADSVEIAIIGAGAAGIAAARRISGTRAALRADRSDRADRRALLHRHADVRGAVRHAAPASSASPISIRSCRSRRERASIFFRQPPASSCGSAGGSPARPNWRTSSPRSCDRAAPSAMPAAASSTCLRRRGCRRICSIGRARSNSCSGRMPAPRISPTCRPRTSPTRRSATATPIAARVSAR